MATDLLVDRLFKDGQILVDSLKSERIDITAAFWAKMGDEGKWFLYVASKLVDDLGSSKAYQRVFVVLRSLSDLSFGDAELKLIAAASPIARGVLSFRSQFSPTTMVHAKWIVLGPLACQEAWVYGDI